MLNGDGNENCKTIYSNILISTKNNFARAAHFCLVQFFAVVLHDHNVKLSSYTFYEKRKDCRM